MNKTEREEILKNLMPAADEEYADIYAAFEIEGRQFVFSAYQFMDETLGEFLHQVQDYCAVDILFRLESQGIEWKGRHEMPVVVYQIDVPHWSAALLTPEAYEKSQKTSQVLDRQFLVFQNNPPSTQLLESATLRFCSMRNMAARKPFVLRQPASAVAPQNAVELLRRLRARGLSLDESLDMMKCQGLGLSSVAGAIREVESMDPQASIDMLDRRKDRKLF